MSVSSMRFPKLLWSITESDRSGAISFGADGDKLVINVDEFEAKYLKTGVFKTTKVSSFIRNLHLYGFVVAPNALEEQNGQKLRVYRHPDFIRSRPELVDRMQRHGAREDRIRASKNLRPNRKTPDDTQSPVGVRPPTIEHVGVEMFKEGLQLVPLLTRIDLNSPQLQAAVEPPEDLLHLPLYNDDNNIADCGGTIFQSALMPKNWTDEAAVLAYLRLL